MIELTNENDPTWIFTYGALMWDPVFTFTERVAGKVVGYSRRFCIHSMTWRGTPEKPGLVAGLAPGGACTGFAYRIPSDTATSALAEADRWELIRDVYIRTQIPVELMDGRVVLAHAYVANLSSAEFRTYTLEQQAEMIRTATGPEGTCAHYLTEIREKLGELGIRDPAVEEIYAQVFSR